MPLMLIPIHCQHSWHELIGMQTKMVQQLDSEGYGLTDSSPRVTKTQSDTHFTLENENERYEADWKSDFVVVLKRLL